jgi:hypothetical protein
MPLHPFPYFLREGAGGWVALPRQEGAGGWVAVSCYNVPEDGLSFFPDVKYLSCNIHSSQNLII